MESLEEKENLLSQKLRSCCDSQGREMSPQKSANIFNELGLLYKSKSPDKISLIQSAALLNAAITRQPSNKKFQQDLKHLCKHVLQCANATSNEADLIQISHDIKQMVQDMRDKTNADLQKIKLIPKTVTIKEVLLKLEKRKIDQIKALQSQIAQQYKDIMACISKFCIEIMGKPPCNAKYALVGMGSLARKEITPYSDFEHIIVLQDFRGKMIKNRKKILEYFRWYSVISHIIIINLQETIIPSVCIRSLNDTSGAWFFDGVTTRGISFDGMMPHASKFPLGRTQTTTKKPFTTELIKPVSKMVQYLDVDEDIKNGYKLADILTKTCFVEGDKNVYEIFEEKEKEVIMRQDKKRFELVKSQLQEDLDNFDILDDIFKVFLVKSWNIKRVIYRNTTLFISALGRIYSSTKNSNFDVLDELKTRKIINGKVTHFLSLAVAIACHFRLHQYMAKKSQSDVVQEYSRNIEVEEFFPHKHNRLLELVQKRELVNFVRGVLCLQSFLLYHKTSEMDLNDYFEGCGFTECKFKIMAKLALFDEIIEQGHQSLKQQAITNPEDFFIFFYIGVAYTQKRDYQKALSYFEQVIESPAWSAVTELDTKFQHTVLINMLRAKFFLQEYESVIEEIDKILQAQNHNVRSDFFILSGDANTFSKHHRKALGSYRNYLRSTKPQDPVVLFRYAQVYRSVSECLLNCGHPDRALGWLFETLEICDLLSIPIKHKLNCCMIIGDCYREMGLIDQAYRYKTMNIEKLSEKSWVPDDMLNLVMC